MGLREDDKTVDVKLKTKLTCELDCLRSNKACYQVKLDYNKVL